MLMDRTTEEIAHFVGLFAVTDEGARYREFFDKFMAAKHLPDDLPSLPALQLDFSAPYLLEGYDPGIAYRPFAPDIVPWSSWTFVEIDSPEIKLKSGAALPNPRLPDLGPAHSAASAKQVIVDIDPLGSVANYMHQGISLSDNDYFSVGSHGLAFRPDRVSDEGIVRLYEAASRISPIPDVEMPGSAEAFAEFARLTADALAAYDPKEQGGSSETESLFVKKDFCLEGTFVNGQEGDAPKLEDFFSFEERSKSGPHSDEPFKPNVTITEHGIVIKDSVTLETGDNVLVNDVVLKNVWTGATVTAVVGDHFEINAIIQINAWWDSDAITDAIASWQKPPSATEAFNIATFERYDPSAEEPDGQDDPDPTFPSYWAVTEIKGDLMIVNWLQQLTFMKDNDIGVVSSSGVTSYVYSGGNTALNGVSLYELGFAYDLIIVGGCVYDLNIIKQLNLMADSDMVGAVAGFQTDGSGTYSTSDNLLWNQAHIYNVGSSGPYEALPAGYQNTAAALANGLHEIDDGVLTDPAFAGQGALRVLYIEGDLVNVQYAEQTNILGDDDQIALALSESGAYADAEWSVATGKNVLINNAAIVDLDSLGKTYVGGEQYSQDLLVQADIISTDPMYGESPDVLVNEAIAFLDDSVDDPAGGNNYMPDNLTTDDAHSDGLHSMIG